MQLPGGPAVRIGAPPGFLPKMGTAVLLIMLLWAWSVPAVLALPAQEAAVVVAPAEISVPAGDRFEMDIAISGVQDLGAFELSVSYDPALIQVDRVTLGDFVGSTDRAVVPLGPIIDQAGGRLDVGALTTGALPGAQGTGVLVTLECTAMRAGEGQVALTEIRLSDTKAQSIAATTADAKVTFTGTVVVPTATAAPATPTLTSLPPTATRLPTETAAPASPTAEVTATARPAETSAPADGTAAPATATALPATATPDPVETLAIMAATATAQAWRTAEAQWTATPTPIATPGPSPTPVPAGASSPTEAPTPLATPVPSQGAGAGSDTGLALGLGVAAVALGAGGILLWRRARRKSS